MVKPLLSWFLTENLIMTICGFSVAWLLKSPIFLLPNHCLIGSHNLRIPLIVFP
ncbi:hypothetical protein Hanom_Chr07g00673901 [Helianthus anomalus]